MPGGLCYLRANPDKASELGQRGGKSSRRFRPSGSNGLTVVDRPVKSVEDVTELLAKAVKIISEEHLSGMEILFGDTAEQLAKRNDCAREFCDCFNQIACRFGANPITGDELDEAAHVATPKQVVALVRLAHAKVEMSSGNGLKVGDLLTPILREVD